MSFLQKRARPILLLTLVLGAILFPGLKQALRIDNSLTSWFIEGDPALQPYYTLQENFGNDEMIVLALEDPEGNTMLSPANQAKLIRLAKAFLADSNLKEVYHPSLWQRPSLMDFGPSSPLIPKNEAKAKEVLNQNEFLKAQFYSDDFLASRLYLKPSQSADFEIRRAEIIQNIYKICDAHWEAEASSFGGLGVIYEALNELSARDFGSFLGLGYLLMFGLIALLYRHWAFTLYALSVVALSSYFTLAIYGSFGLRLNLLSTLIPTIIILLGVMDVMHILNEFRKANGSLSAKERTYSALKSIWKPCLFTSLSTMAGFLSLAISPVAVLAEFGIFSALGIALALFFSFLLGFILIPLAPLPAAQDRTSASLAKLQDWVSENPKPIWALTALLVLAAAWSIPQLKVDTDSIAYLPKDHTVRKQSERIEALFGPYMPLDYLVELKEGNLNDLEIQQSLYEFDRSLAQLPHIGAMNGYHDLLAAIIQQEDSVKNWELGSAQKFYLQSFNSKNPELKRSFINDEGTMGRFYLSGELISARALKETLAQVDSLALEKLGPNIRITAAGYQSLYANIVNYVTESQIRSISFAAVLIFLLLWLFLGNLRLSLISLIPNFFPVMMLLSVMVWFDIALDTATASIASIVLSFSIDDTMHFIWHYRKGRLAGESPSLARKKTMAHVGRAIVFTSLVLFVGYSLMWFGSLRTVVYFGTLTASSIVAALVSQLFLFPLLLKKWDKE
ncbi:MAG: efflux RND transporter permease subunit [Croceimicrobium sp.]